MSDPTSSAQRDVIRGIAAAPPEPRPQLVQLAQAHAPRRIDFGEPKYDRPGASKRLLYELHLWLKPR